MRRATVLVLLLQLLAWSASVARAQTPRRLPPVYAANAPDSVFTDHTDPTWSTQFAPPPYGTSLSDAGEPVIILDEADSGPQPPPGARNGVFQKLLFSWTWGPALSEGDFGFTDLNLSTVWGFPFPTVESPLLVTPSFGVSYLEGPEARDLPARLYSTGLDFRWIRPINERLMMDLGVGVGYYSDFEIDSGDALRITGRGLGIYQWSPETTVVLGVVYLDRNDVSILPAAGMIWKPTDDWALELIFPQPKLARRVYHCGTDRGLEYWAYLAAEFGGGQWAIASAGGEPELITLRDYRLLLGVESKLPGGLGTRLELGYIFGREIEFASATPDYKPDDTVLLRVGASY